MLGEGWGPTVSPAVDRVASAREIERASLLQLCDRMTSVGYHFIPITRIWLDTAFERRNNEYTLVSERLRFARVICDGSRMASAAWQVTRF